MPNRHAGAMNASIADGILNGEQKYMAGITTRTIAEIMPVTRAAG